MSLRARYRNVVVGLVLAGLVSVVAVVAAQSGTKSSTATSGLTVHEWGTFTSVAGQSGAGVQWHPLGGPADLPCFVRTLGSGIKWVSNTGGTPPNPLAAMAASVRMETPVLYFYADQDTRVDVAVQFPSGVISEWYPHATVQPTFAPADLTSTTGGIYWNGLMVKPGARPDFLTEPGPSHYYAARATDAAPVQLNGQTEKFLFYRGLANFQVPLRATVSDAGQFLVESPATKLSHLVLFENRGGRVGYRVVKDVEGRTTIDAPQLTSDVATLGLDLEQMLTAQGLYAREAKAMVDTWRDSWFEEGARIFYILPQATVDRLLPLSVSPQPAKLVRTFVGRLEVFTPAVQDEVERAFLKRDLPTLNKYGRFLEPIAYRLTTKSQSPLDPARANELIRLVAASRVPEVSCR